MTPMRANIVGPPDVATRDQRLHGGLPFRGLVSALGCDVLAGVFEGDKLSAVAAGQVLQTAASNLDQLLAGRGMHGSNANLARQPKMRMPSALARGGVRQL
jgi:hypothetical protein